jgi:myosin-15
MPTSEANALFCEQLFAGTANVCLQNLRKTLRYGGRKNVPSVEEVTAVSAGRNSKRQLYRLPGGSETVVNTKSTTVVADVIAGMCSLINVNDPLEMEEFSLYCIVEGDAFTMPLAADEYILDVTTELHKNQQVNSPLPTVGRRLESDTAPVD